MVAGPGEIPPCGCGSKFWRAVLTPPYVLTRKDWAVLKALGIDPEQERPSS